MKDLIEIVTAIKEICNDYPVMDDRLNALEQAGYDEINYVYLKGRNVLIPSSSIGLYAVKHLPKKHLYRIQIGYTELLKGYPAAWC